jgi:adenylate kinase
MINYLLYGSPGSGKGTVCEEMKSRGYVVLAMGVLLRKQLKEKTPLGKIIELNVNQGILIPDTIAYELMEKEVINTKKPFVIEGFPSTITQYRQFSPYLKKYNIKILYLKCEPDLALERILSRMMCEFCEAIYNIRTKPSNKENICDQCSKILVKRPEDEPIRAKKRIATFHEKTFSIFKPDLIIDCNLPRDTLLSQISVLLDGQEGC